MEGKKQMVRKKLIGYLENIIDLVERYIMVSRSIYLAQIEQVKPKSDLILNGEQSVEDLAKAIIDAAFEDIHIEYFEI